jgi:hypothetical protein
MRRLAALAAVGALALLSACSESSSGSPSGSGFSAKADAACKTATSQLQSVKTSGQPLQQMYFAVDDDVQSLLRAVDGLVPSNSEQGAVYQLLDGYRAISTAAVSASQSLNSGSEPATVASAYASATSAPLASINAASQSLRIPDCANPPVTP